MVHWVRREHTRQKIRLLERFFAKLLAHELLDLGGSVGFPADDSHGEKGWPNGFAVLLRLLAVDPGCPLAFLEPVQIHALAKGYPQP